jgi:hypothetical protein
MTEFIAHDDFFPHDQSIQELINLLPLFLQDHLYLDDLKQHERATKILYDRATHQAGCGCSSCTFKAEKAKEYWHKAREKYTQEYHRQNQFHQDQEELFIEAIALALLNARLEEKRDRGETGDE